MINSKLKRWLLTTCMTAGIIGATVTAGAYSDPLTDPLGTMSGMSGVTFALENGDASEAYANDPRTGMYFTTNKANVPAGIDVQEGQIVYTQYKDLQLVKDRLQTGQHLYSKNVDDKLVKVKYWYLSWPQAQCIHDGETPNLIHTENKCSAYYNMTSPGWIGYCADCGKLIQNMLYYMDAGTAKTFDHIQMGYYYYFKCPHCDNLEQGCTTAHVCEDISWNRYTIVYNKNDSTTSIKARGYMPDSTHYYNNAVGEEGGQAEYEGESVTPQTTLSKNQYSRPGYVFTGWNTKRNGSGQSFTNEQEIFNLSSTDKATIRLYAQWEKVSTTLSVIADSGKPQEKGATYNGQSTYETNVDYLGTEYVEKALVIPGTGYQVVFDTKGGELIGLDASGLEDTTKDGGFTKVTVNPVKDWLTVFPDGTGGISTLKSDGVNALFTNLATENGLLHTIQVTYDYDGFFLPYAEKTGESFAGWKLMTGTAAGENSFSGGADITPNENMAESGVIRFEAVYSDLAMTAVADYEVNDMKGAADLKWGWSRPLSNITSYKVYRGTELLYRNEEGTEADIPQTGNIISSAKSGTYTILYTGLYEFTLSGNKGGDIGEHTGGAGGSITGQVFLMKGDILKYDCSDSDFAGGKGKAPEDSGAETLVSDGGNAGTLFVKRTDSGEYVPLAVAGGGSGATEEENGKDAEKQLDTSEGSDHTGADGMYAGGGGWNGGAGGELVYHDHRKSGCTGIHEHTKDCYHKHTDDCGKKEVPFSWLYCPKCDGSYGETNPGSGICGNCGTTTLITLTGTTETWACGKEEGELDCDRANKSHTHTDSCYDGTTNKLTCGYNIWQCGKDETFIDSVKAASAGTNYVDETKVFNVTVTNNEKKTGSVSVKSIELGFDTATGMDDVKAEDKAAPEKAALSRKFTDLEKATVVINIEKPADNGTDYYFSVEACDLGIVKDSADAVPSPLTLTTNVKGYRIEVFNNETGEYKDTKDIALDIIKKAKGSQPNVTSDEDVSITFEMLPYEQRLKVYTIDFAGNESLAEITVPSLTGGEDHTDNTLFQIYTKQLTATESTRVYKSASKEIFNGFSYPTYYVKADGLSSFTLNGMAYTSLLSDYNNFMINKLQYHFYDTEFNNDITQPDEKIVIKADEVKDSFTQTSYSSDIENLTIPLIIPYGNSPAYMRQDTEETRELLTKMNFTVTASQNGKRILAVPRADAEQFTLKETVQSDLGLDKENGIIIIPDAEGPVITGNNISEIIEGYKNGTITFPATLTIPVTDELSGVRTAMAEIINRDNGSYKVLNLKDGKLETVIKEGDALFMGDVDITITCEDNVSNTSTFTYGFEAASIDVSMYNKDSLVDGEIKHHYFLYDDTGVLNIHATGYIDKIEITQGDNPTAVFADNNKTTYTISFTGDKTADISFENSKLTYDTELEFKVNKEMDGQVYFEVRCYKDGYTNVTVNHYQMDPDGKGYTLAYTSVMAKKENRWYTFRPLEFEGFEVPDTKGMQIQPDKDNVIDFYYERKQYELTVNAGEGIEETSGSGTYYYGQSITVDCVPESGMDFNKWTGDKESSDKEFTFLMPAKDITITATGIPHAYRILYHPNGGTGLMEDTLHSDGIEEVLRKCAFTKAYHHFGSWNTLANGSGEGFDDEEEFSDALTLEDTITLYAQWKPNTITINYKMTDPEEGAFSTTKTRTYTYGDEENTFIGCVYDETDYFHFDHWNVYTTDNRLVGSFYQEADIDSAIPAEYYTEGAVFTAEAVYEANTYRIVYNGNENTGGTTPESQTVDCGDYVRLQDNTFIKRGHVFTGWNTESDGSGDDYNGGQLTNKIFAENNETVTLYAQWEKITFSITYTDGYDKETYDIEYGEEYFICDNMFDEPEYHHFTAWTTNPDGTDDGYGWSLRYGTWDYENGEYGIKDDMLTLYAVYAPNTITVVYDINADGTEGEYPDTVHTYGEDSNIRKIITKTGYYIKELYISDAYYTGNIINGGEIPTDELFTENEKEIIVEVDIRPVHYSIRYDGNGATGSMADTHVDSYFDDISLSNNIYTRNGYKFLGWAETPDGEVIYADGQTVQGLTEEVDSTITLYAVWEKCLRLKYEIVFKSESSGLKKYTLEQYTYNDAGETVDLLTTYEGAFNKLYSDDYLSITWSDVIDYRYTVTKLVGGTLKASGAYNTDSGRIIPLTNDSDCTVTFITEDYVDLE